MKMLKIDNLVVAYGGIEALKGISLEVEEGKIISFFDGIPGFEEEKKFLVIPYSEESPFVFLQSLKTAELAFLMTTPFVFFPEYEFEIDDESIEALGIEKEEDGREQKRKQARKPGMGFDPFH